MSQGNSSAAEGPQKLSEKMSEPSNKQQIELSLEMDGPADVKIGEGNATVSSAAAALNAAISAEGKDHISIV